MPSESSSPSEPSAAHDKAGGIDRAALRQAARRAAVHYDAAAVLQREVAARMAARLECMKLAPARVLDLGCGTGADLEFLGRAWPDAQRIACDWSPEMLAQARRRTSALGRWLPWRDRGAPKLVCADAARLPLKGGSVGLVWSNLLLHWLADPAAALREALRVLEVGGLLIFSTLGPDTLKELRQASRGARGAPQVLTFADMHDLGDMLTTAGLSDPVMEMEMITLTYADLASLLVDLRHAASINPDPGRRRGLGGRRAWQRVREAYEGQRRDGRLPASFEVVYGHAWKVAPRTSADGRAIVQFDATRRGRGKP
jgi:malonyl-CoA O-methyltransferase